MVQISTECGREVETGHLNAYDSTSCLLSTSELVGQLVDYVEDLECPVEPIGRIVFRRTVQESMLSGQYMMRTALPLGSGRRF